MPGVIHVVDDDHSFRTAIERRLKLAGYRVATYASADDLLNAAPTDDEPGCILLDVRLPRLSGPGLQARLNQSGCTLPVIFLTGHADTPTTVLAIKSGAEDFLTKPIASEVLIETIERAIVRHRAALAQRSKLGSFRNQLATLTQRERQVFDLVVRGRINKQIAHQFGTTERTVKAHRQQVMTKMQVQSLAELVSIAERLGMLQAGSD